LMLTRFHEVGTAYALVSTTLPTVTDDGTWSPLQ
jgi:hypothetical protein